MLTITSYLLDLFRPYNATIVSFCKMNSRCQCTFVFKTTESFHQMLVVISVKAMLTLTRTFRPSTITHDGTPTVVGRRLVSQKLEHLLGQQQHQPETFYGAVETSCFASVGTEGSLRPNMMLLQNILSIPQITSCISHQPDANSQGSKKGTEASLVTISVRPPIATRTTGCQNALNFPNHIRAIFGVLLRLRRL